MKDCVGLLRCTAQTARQAAAPGYHRISTYPWGRHQSTKRLTSVSGWPFPHLTPSRCYLTVHLPHLRPPSSLAPLLAFLRPPVVEKCFSNVFTSFSSPTTGTGIQLEAKSAYLKLSNEHTFRKGLQFWVASINLTLTSGKKGKHYIKNRQPAVQGY